MNKEFFLVLTLILASGQSILSVQNDNSEVEIEDLIKAIKGLNSPEKSPKADDEYKKDKIVEVLNLVYQNPSIKDELKGEVFSLLLETSSSLEGDFRKQYFNHRAFDFINKFFSSSLKEKKALVFFKFLLESGALENEINGFKKDCFSNITFIFTNLITDTFAKDRLIINVLEFLFEKAESGSIALDKFKLLINYLSDNYKEIKEQANDCLSLEGLSSLKESINNMVNEVLSPFYENIENFSLSRKLLIQSSLIKSLQM